VYNVIFEGKGIPPAPVDNGHIIDDICIRMEEWQDAIEEGKEMCPKLIYMMEHKYTKENIGFDTLKARDRIVVEALLSAKRRSKEKKSVKLKQKKTKASPP